MVNINSLLLLTAVLSSSALAVPYSINYKNKPRKSYLRKNRNSRNIRKARLNQLRYNNEYDYSRPDYIRPDPTKNYRLFPLGWNSVDDFYPPYASPYVSEVEYDSWVSGQAAGIPPPPPPPASPYKAYSAAAAAAAIGPIGGSIPYASGSSSWAVSGEGYYYDDFVGVGIAPSIGAAPAFLDSAPLAAAPPLPFNRPYSTFDPYVQAVNIPLDDTFRKVYNYETKTVEKWFTNEAGRLLKERTSYRDGTKIEKWLLEYGWFSTTWLTDGSVIQEDWNRVNDIKKKFEYFSNGLKTETVIFEDGSKRKFKFTDDDMLISQIFVDSYGNVIEELSLE